MYRLGFIWLGWCATDKKIDAQAHQSIRVQRKPIAFYSTRNGVNGSIMASIVPFSVRTKTHIADIDNMLYIEASNSIYQLHSFKLSMICAAIDLFEPN